MESAFFGKGTVVEIDENDTYSFPIYVKFKNKNVYSFVEKDSFLLVFSDINPMERFAYLLQGLSFMLYHE